MWWRARKRKTRTARPRTARGRSGVGWAKAYCHRHRELVSRACAVPTRRDVAMSRVGTALHGSLGGTFCVSAPLPVLRLSAFLKPARDALRTRGAAVDPGLHQLAQ